MTATRLFARRFVRLDGADRSIDVAAFLEPRISNRITHYLPVWAGLLDDQGRVLFDFLVCPSSKHLAQVWRGVNGERASSGVGF